jgi:predicted nucleic acid-binding protein
VLDGRLSATAGQEAIADLLALRLPLAYPDGLLRVAYDFSFRYALSLYDAFYVALAQIEQCQLITGDDRIVRALGVRLTLALPIEYYEPQN